MSGKGNAWMKLDHTSIDWVIVTYHLAVSEKIIATTQSTSRTTLKVAKVNVSTWEKPVLEYNFILIMKTLKAAVNYSSETVFLNRVHMDLQTKISVLNQKWSTSILTALEALSNLTTMIMEM